MTSRKNFRVIKPRPNGEAINTVRRICREIESGEITSVGWVLVRRGGDVSTGWENAGNATHHLISGASVLAYRLTVAAREDAE